MNIGLRIKELRTKKKMTQKSLAESINIDYSQMTKIEKGKIQPTLKQLIDISSIFKISIDWIITGQNYAKKVPSATTFNFKLEDFNALLKQNNELLTENNRFLKLQIDRLNKEIINLKKENKPDTSYSLVAESQPKLKK